MTDEKNEGAPHPVYAPISTSNFPNNHHLPFSERLQGLTLRPEILSVIHDEIVMEFASAAHAVAAMAEAAAAVIQPHFFEPSHVSRPALHNFPITSNSTFSARWREAIFPEDIYPSRDNATQAHPWYPSMINPGDRWGDFEKGEILQAHRSHHSTNPPAQKWLCPASKSWWQVITRDAENNSHSQPVPARCCYVIELLLSLDHLLRSGTPLMRHEGEHFSVFESREGREEAIVEEAKSALAHLKGDFPFRAPRAFPGMELIPYTYSPLPSACLLPFWLELQAYQGWTTCFLHQDAGGQPPCIFLSGQGVVFQSFLNTHGNPGVVRREVHSAAFTQYESDVSCEALVSVQDVVEHLRYLSHSPPTCGPFGLVTLASRIWTLGWEREYLEVFGGVDNLSDLTAFLRQLVDASNEG